MSLFLNKNSHSGRNSCICKVLQRRLTRASSRDKAISGNQPIQETHVVCNIVAGVVTLLMACVFAAGWMRSKSITDNFGAPIHGRFEVGISSINNSIDFALFIRGSADKTIWAMPDHDVVENDPNDVDFDCYDEFIWFINTNGFRLGYFLPPQCCHIVCLIPYWSIVIPLTLLSVWLLLSRPREKPATR